MSLLTAAKAALEALETCDWNDNDFPDDTQYFDRFAVSEAATKLRAAIARLRTTLEIDVKWKDTSVVLYSTDPLGWQEFYADHSGDKNAALRWATLRLAAEIGRRMLTGEILTELAQEAQKDGLYD